MLRLVCPDDVSAFLSATSSFIESPKKLALLRLSGKGTEARCNGGRGRRLIGVV